VGFSNEQPAAAGPAIPTAPDGRVGRPAAATFCESLADADDAALQRLYKRNTSKKVTFGHHFEKGGH
jgi:hypothetical protein